MENIIHAFIFQIDLIDRFSFNDVVQGILEATFEPTAPTYQTTNFILLSRFKKVQTKRIRK